MSEFRQDPVSRDWVIIAPGRAKRPDELVKKRPPRSHARTPKATCPFENLEKSGNWPPLLAYMQAGKWEIVAVPNKYPAVVHADGHAKEEHRGMYRVKNGIGDHELVICRDHDKGLADLSSAAAARLFTMFRARALAMADDPCNAYVCIFMNWGPAAGASLWHPHYQILTLPIVPPHVAHSLHGSEVYFKRHKRCVRCDAMREDRQDGTRVVAENAHAIAIVPFASKRPFEVSILPKKHIPAFEDTPAAVMAGVADMAQRVLRAMRKNIGDPDLNMFVHSAPIDGKSYAYHHWHIEIVPVNVVSPQGGFEVSSAVNINVIDPAAAAKILKKK